MKHMAKFVCKRSAAVSVLGAVALVMVILAFVLSGNFTYAADRHDVTSTRRNLSAGVTETEYYTNNADNNDQTVVYAVDVDLSQNTLIAGYKDYDTSGSWGMQTVREQAAAAEAKRGVNIVAAVNGDFYNMGTGEPTGVLVMNGQQVKVNSSALARNWFAVTADNKAYIGTGALPENTVEAIGGDRILIRNGEIILGEGDYYVTKQPRTAVGIKADGNVVLLSANGRQAPYSSGYTGLELAQKMIELGCVDALNLDGGGSATYLAQYAGTDELVLANSPSDGQERSVSSSLFVVSNSEPTGIFGSVSIEPANEVYTPGSVVELSAIGADTAGFACAIPSGALWKLADESAAMGSLSGSIEEDGTARATLTSVEGTVGTAVVELVYEGEVYGSATIELQWPDTLTMENSQFSLDFSERTDFGLAAYWETRSVHLKAGDLVWEIGETGSEEFPVLGVMDGDFFVADAEATNVTATVTAKLAHNTAVAVSAEVSVGQLPTVVWDFEDVTDESGEVVETAESYYENSENFHVTNVNNTTSSLDIVDIYTGEVRVGQKALQINYDFTYATPTAGVYFGPTNPIRISGIPTAIGLWIYIPEGENFSYWLRTRFLGYDANGNIMAGNSFGTAFGADFNGDNNVALSSGWNYIEADLSVANSYGASYYELTNETFRIMMTSNSGDKSSGYIYIDNVQFVYGANTDDIFAPEINSVNLNSESGIALSENSVTSVSDDPFYIYASYNEFTGLSEEELAAIEDEAERERYEKAPLYATGVNTENIHIYVDGNEVKLNSVYETYLVTEGIHLPNGIHEITIEVYDNFQNLATKSYLIEVGNQSEYAGVSLEGAGEAPYLGSDYLLELVADLPETVQEVSFQLRLASGFEINPGESVPGFTVASSLTHVNNNIYTVTVTRSSGEYSGSGVIANLVIPCSASLLQGAVLTYSVESSSVTYADNLQEDVINSFYAEAELEVLPYYMLEADPMVVGSEGGYIYVTDANGSPAAGVTVAVDGEPLEEVTDAEGKVFTDAFVQESGYKTVAAYSDAGYSYGQRVYGVLPGGVAQSADPLYVRAVATGDGCTEQRIVWLSNPLYAQEKAIIKYAPAAAYEEDGEQAFVAAEGQTLFVEFTNTYAVNVNQVLVAGLTEDTEYVYIVGDGEAWSGLHTFATAKRNADTNFFIIGDTQEDNPTAIEAYCNAILNSGINYDFAIQTGDFVDNGGNYALWSGILELFAPLSDVDFVQVFGNHEYEGNDGSYPEAMNYVPGRDYYSVTYGNVYVAVINIYTVDGLNEAMDWIRQDAANSGAVWKVLTMHRPPYYTNISGGSDTAHEMIPAFVDEVGFDVVFSGHDHSFARTKPMTGGVVDEENGTVYYIVGAAESGRYGIYNDPAFNFAKVSGDFNALYFSVHATDTQMQITVYNLTDDGSGFEVFDSYTIRNACASLGHDFSYTGGRLVCDRCHYSALPSEIGFSGLVQDDEGRNWYFNRGSLWTGWLQYGEDQYYFLEDGSAADGEVVLNGTMEVGEEENQGQIVFTFENGKKVGGETRWYGEKYYVDGSFVTGWTIVDGEYYYLWTSGHYDAGYYPEYEVGDRVKGGLRRVTVDMGGYDMPVYFYFDDDGKLLGPVNDEDGNMLPGNFYYRDNQGIYGYMVLVQQEDGSIVGDYYRLGWLTGNDVVPEAEGNLYYVEWDILLFGEQEIGGRYYRFGEKPADCEVGNQMDIAGGVGALVGRYYTVRLNQYTGAHDSVLVYQGEKIPEEYLTPAPVEGNSIKYYRFDGWRSGCTYVDLANWVANGDLTVNAQYTRVYYQIYGDVVWANGKLASAETPAEKRAALATMDDVYAKLTDENIADCIAEDKSIFDLYDSMREKLYTITFVTEAGTVQTSELYEGEAISAPEDPSKDSDTSIARYVFVGWFDGETQYAAGMTASQDMTFTAQFAFAYTEEYQAMQSALSALRSVENGTLEERYKVLSSVYSLLQNFSGQMRADAEAEGMSFALYDEMLADYNGTVGGAEEDLNAAAEASDTLLAVAAAAAAVSMLAVLAFLAKEMII